MKRSIQLPRITFCDALTGAGSVHLAALNIKAGARARRIGRGFVFLWFFLGGIAHFTATRLEMRIVPPYIGHPRAAVLLTGVCELLGAAGLLYRPTRRAAGVGLFALTVAVTPANIYMLQRHELFHVPYWLLVLRLPLQGALLALIAWSALWPFSEARPGQPWLMRE